MEYQEINFLGDGLFAVEKNDLWGVINISGQVVVPLIYQGITERYGSAFIVTDYREEYRNKPKEDEVTYLGDLWKHQGIVGVGGKVLVDFEKYQKISVDTAGRFTCSVWTGGYRTAGYYGGAGEDMRPMYANEYTYECIDYKDLDITIDVSDMTSPFSDVNLTDYFTDAVKWAIKKEITNGTSNTTFSPSQTCTNAEILTFLYRASGEPEPTIANPYSNVSTADYYYKAALWAAEKGMVTGSSFLAGTPCSRASAVNFIWQAMDCPTPTTSARFSDVSHLLQL